VSKPADRDPVLTLLFLGGYSIFMAIVFWVVWSWFWSIPR